MTVGELNHRMDTRELESWRIYDQVHIPIEYHMVAQICQVLARCHGSKTAKHSDFLPQRRKLWEVLGGSTGEVQPQSMEVLKAKMNALRAALSTKPGLRRRGA